MCLAFNMYTYILVTPSDHYLAVVYNVSTVLCLELQPPEPLKQMTKSRMLTQRIKLLNYLGAFIMREHKF